MPFPSRRRFLVVAGSAVGGLALGAAARRSGLPPDLLAEQRGPHRPWQSVTKTSWALGADVSMTALHADRGAAEAALEAAFAELELVEELMSIYRPHSQISRLNRGGVLEGPHPFLVHVLQQSQQWAEQTGGAFDVTVQPLWELYQEAKRQGQLPSDSEVAAARQRVDWRRLEVTPTRVVLRDGARITLNGIAQGFAADRAMQALRSRGVEHALVNTGELGAMGHKESGHAWTVGIQHPRRPEAYVSLAKLAGRCLATSGDYETTFSPDFRHHHLFDPRTGRSPQELASVSIAARTATEADALSTAVFVLGPEAGGALVRRTPGADALLVLKDGRTLATEGFPRDA
jgi:thiamine biosynthesis lipoprotein